MRKFFEKFGLLMQIVISTVFIVFILMLMFGVLNKADFQNNVVYILFGTFIVLQITFSVLLLYLQYTADLLNSVTVGNMQNASIKASITVIRKIIKIATAGMVGVKVGHAKVTVDEKGIALHLRVKLDNKLPEQAIAELRAAIISAFKVRLNLEFCFINFLISSVKFPQLDADTIAKANAETDTKVNVAFADEDMDDIAREIANRTSVQEPIQSADAQPETAKEESIADTAEAQEEAKEAPAKEESVATADDGFKTFDEETEEDVEEEANEATEAIVLGNEEDFISEEEEQNE